MRIPKIRIACFGVNVFCMTAREPGTNYEA